MIKYVVFFNQQELLDCLSELLIKMLFVSFRHVGLGLQNYYFGHYQSILLVLVDLVFKNHVQLVEVLKVDLPGFLVFGVNQQAQIVI
jgi:uncharacterized membrane protein YfhO